MKPCPQHPRHRERSEAILTLKHEHIKYNEMGEC